MDLFRVLALSVLCLLGTLAENPELLSKQGNHNDALFRLGHMERVFIGLSPLLQLQTEGMPSECVLLVLACKNERNSVERCRLVKEECINKLQHASEEAKEGFLLDLESISTMNTEVINSETVENDEFLKKEVSE
jgi:hypothetical protein